MTIIATDVGLRRWHPIHRVRDPEPRCSFRFCGRSSRLNYNQINSPFAISKSDFLNSRVTQGRTSFRSSIALCKYSEGAWNTSRILDTCIGDICRRRTFIEPLWQVGRTERRKRKRGITDSSGTTHNSDTSGCQSGTVFVRHRQRYPQSMNHPYAPSAFALYGSLLRWQFSAET